MNIYDSIKALLDFGQATGLFKPEDRVYTANHLFEYLNLEGRLLEGDSQSKEVDSQSKEDISRLMQENQLHAFSHEHLHSILEDVIQWAYETGRIKSTSADFADLFDSGLMNGLMGRPSEIIAEFERLRQISPVKATDYLYALGMNSNYIRMNRIQKNMLWKASSAYGELDITINLSKPEKDPKAIAEALKQQNTEKEQYPQCLLCIENEGYRGRFDHPARQNIRLMPLTLKGESWKLQYSPYSYYTEHCIVLSDEHTPMKMTPATFERLLDFVEAFPHYFIGSNADLPIVGGSILTHDHFQGGRFEFAMAKAESEKEYVLRGYEDVRVSRVNWPMSVLRIKSSDKKRVTAAATHIFKHWQSYSDTSVGILSESEGRPHNTVTPIARMRDGDFELDIVLRNNRTDDQYPEGIYHPHRDIHHIKRENIGLIEVMGLAVLPGRLSVELDLIAEVLSGLKSWADVSQGMAHHEAWFYELREAYTSELNTENNLEHNTEINLDPHAEQMKAQAWAMIKREVGVKFLKALEHAGVFKRDEKGLTAFDRFVESL